MPQIVAAGGFDRALEVLASGTPLLFAVALAALCSPLAIILSGTGLIRLGAADRWLGIFILTVGIGFVTAQALLIGLRVLYPFAMLLLLIGSAPIGWRLLQEKKKKTVSAPNFR